jgi:flagellar hook-associated protein 1 FlgK
MADLLNIGTSGLLAFQNALTTTSHNISNVNTDGYSRQRVDLTTRNPQVSGAGFFGTGVNVQNVARIYDQFLTDQVRIQTASNSQLETYYDLASRVDNLLADPEAGLAPAVQEFFDAMQGLADNPTSQAARQVLISNAESMVNRFHSIYDSVYALQTEVNTKLSGTVGEINTLSAQLADLNTQIVTQKAAANGKEPNDLLDQRDELLRKLAEKVSVSTIAQGDGAVNVFVGTGQQLVLGGNFQQLAITTSQYDQSKYEIAIKSSTGATTNITPYLKGGEIGGLVKIREEILAPALNSLGRVALGLQETFNEQHKLGLDLQGNQGLDFFSFIGDTAAQTLVPSRLNNGGASGSFTIDNITNLTTSDYTLKTNNGTLYTLVRDSDNTLIGSFNGPGTYTAASEGITVTIGAGAAAGDSFQFRPTRTAARDIKQMLFDTNRVAAASPLRTRSAIANLGSAVMTQPVLDTSVVPRDGTTTPLSVTNLNLGAAPVPAVPGSNLQSPITNFNFSGAGLAQLDIDGIGITLTANYFDEAGLAAEIATQLNAAAATPYTVTGVNGSGSITIAHADPLDAVAVVVSNTDVNAQGAGFIDSPGTVGVPAQPNSNASFDVDGAPILLAQNYANLNSLIADVNTQLPANYIAANVSGQMVITHTGSTVPVVISNADVNAINAGVVNSPGVAGLSALNSTSLATMLVAGDVTLSYDAAIPGFNVSGAISGTIAYNPATTTSMQIDLGVVDPNYAGVTFDVSGMPLTGDTFTITRNNGAVGDNGNALRLAGINSLRMLNGGQSTLQTSYGQMVSDVGSRTHQADVAATAQLAVLRGADEAKQNVSGVNLDEEAANLIKYQQAYQAVAQTISIGQSLFQTLLDAVR